MRTTVETPAGPAWIDLDAPAKPKALLALTHGAGGGVETVDLLAIRDAGVAAGIAVALITQAYRVKGRGAPPKPDPQDAAWLPVLAELCTQKAMAKLPLIIGGRSNGARVACRTANAAGATAVVVLAFPLHPPGKPEKSRLDELEATGLPTLVVQGDRDAFGMPPEDPRWQRVVVPGDHSLKKDPAAVASAVIDFVLTQRR
jgi:predicted alpha/beta-hydrolase family hydrolase